MIAVSIFRYSASHLRTQSCDSRLTKDSTNDAQPSPPEKQSFWRRYPGSARSSNHRDLVDENEPFSISRESFDSYRRSFVRFPPFSALQNITKNIPKPRLTMYRIFAPAHPSHTPTPSPPEPPSTPASLARPACPQAGSRNPTRWRRRNSRKSG
jgi:hypothetical protein